MQRGFYDDVIEDLLNEQAHPSDDDMAIKLNSIVNPRLLFLGKTEIILKKFKKDVEIWQASRSDTNSLDILPTMGVDDIVKLFMKDRLYKPATNELTALLGCVNKAQRRSNSNNLNDNFSSYCYCCFSK
jgi:hypothetical protein